MFKILERIAYKINVIMVEYNAFTNNISCAEGMHYLFFGAISCSLNQLRQGIFTNSFYNIRISISKRKIIQMIFGSK